VKIGLFVLGDYHDRTVTAGERFEQLLLQAQLAEDLGFESVWYAEHHFSPYGMIANPLTIAAAAAQRTTSIRIGTGVVVVPFSHPLRIAEEATTVDALSNGRLDLGIGRGYQPVEFRRYGIELEESQARFDETVEILEHAFTAEPFEHHGRFWSFEETTVMPPPTQRPIPMWFAAGSPATFERLGRQGRRILTSPNFTPPEMIRALNATYLEHFDATRFGVPTIPMMKQTYVAPTHAAAIRTPKEHSLLFYHLLGQVIADEGVTHESYEMYSKGKRRLETVTYDRLLTDGVIFGTPEEVAERILEHRELHVTDFFVWMDFGGLPFAEVVASIELFARRALPILQAESSVPQQQAART
jgi:alkanesulfonate monooxygenase SsuD/methylene tetrahydromethanopterin reductase-like flavin-dependent oxidoreductase (luciferase family)